MDLRRGNFKSHKMGSGLPSHMFDMQNILNVGEGDCKCLTLSLGRDWGNSDEYDTG